MGQGQLQAKERLDFQSIHKDIPQEVLDIRDVFIKYVRNKITIDLGWAAQNGILELVQEFLAGGNISDIDRAKALPVSAESGHLAIVQAILGSRNISDIEESISYECCALVNAAGAGHLEIVQFLLARDSDDQLDNALIKAVNGGHLEIV